MKVPGAVVKVSGLFCLCSETLITGDQVLKVCSGPKVVKSELTKIKNVRCIACHP